MKRRDFLRNAGAVVAGIVAAPLAAVAATRETYPVLILGKQAMVMHHAPASEWDERQHAIKCLRTLWEDARKQSFPAKLP